MSNQWTTVKHKLPKSTGEYIVWGYRNGSREIGILYFDGEFWSGEAGHPITHWMKLPKPPGTI